MNGKSPTPSSLTDRLRRLCLLALLLCPPALAETSEQLAGAQLLYLELLVNAMPSGKVVEVRERQGVSSSSAAS